MLKEILFNLLKSIPKDNVALGLSGGVDSQVLLCTMLDCGIRPFTYTFCTDDRETRDLIVARNIANYYGLEHKTLTLSTDIDFLYNSAIELNNKYLCRKKTDYECFYPFLFIYPFLKENGIKTLVLGSYFDGWVLSSKKATIHYRGREDEWRQIYHDKPNSNQVTQHSIAQNYYGITVTMPYGDESVYNFFLGKSYEWCNKPKPKQCMIDLYPTHFARFKPVRHTNYQLCGIADAFAKLVNSKYNTKNYKSVVGIYNEINRGNL